MMAYAIVSECDGRYYIGPLYVGINGTSFETQSDAEYVARAINRAYEAGAESVREAMRDVLRVPHPTQEGC